MASTTYKLELGKYNNALTHKTALSTADLTAIATNPNLLGKLGLSAGTIPELDLALDASDGYYPMSEKSGEFVVDVRAGYGVELTTNVFSSYGTNTCVDNLDGTFTLTVNDDARGAWTDISAKLEVGEKYLLIYSEISSTIAGGNTGVLDGVQTIINPRTTPSYIFTSQGTGNRIRFVSLPVGLVLVFSYSLREATAQEIANYTTDTRLIQQTAGQQAFETKDDALGLPYEMAGADLEFNGDGRFLETNWIYNNTSAFSIELVQTINENNLNETIGCDDLQLGKNSSNEIFIRIGGQYIYYTPPTYNTQYHSILTYDGNGTAKLHINGVLVDTLGSVAPTATTQFTVSQLNNDLQHPIFFKVYNPILTEAEILIKYQGHSL